MEKKTVRIKIMHPEEMHVCKISEPKSKQEMPQDIVDRLSEVERLVNEAFMLASAYDIIDELVGEGRGTRLVVDVYKKVNNIRSSAFRRIK